MARPDDRAPTPRARPEATAAQVNDALAPTVGTGAGLRLSDTERDEAVARLAEHAAVGRLTLEELTERVGAAMSAVTGADLAPIFADLPGPGPSGAPTGAPVPREGLLSRRTSALTVAVMASASRRGRWRLRRRAGAVALLGSCTIDLRTVEVTTPVVTVDALAVMGSVTVVVPEGIDVELAGLAVMGSKRFRVRNVPAAPGTPRVRVRAWALMGSVTVVSRSPARVRRLLGPLRR